MNDGEAVAALYTEYGIDLTAGNYEEGFDDEFADAFGDIDFDEVDRIF